MLFYIEKEGDQMSDTEQQRKPNKSKQKKENKMNRKDVEDLMNIHKSVYKRHRGAVRRK